MAAAKSKKLNSAEVDVLINALIDSGNISYVSLLEFAVKVNGAEFKKPPAKKAKAMTMAVAKKAVLDKFECRTVTELRKNKTFSMSMTGEEITLKTKADWMRLYRRWVSVPESERNQNGPICINGIDVLENFRPWHVFGLDPKFATPDDVKASYRELVKTHHPDAGGDGRVFAQLQKMRDSVLALMN
jgi:hypothetical protein